MIKIAKKEKKNILVTGGAGFIGGNFIKSVAMRADVKEEYNFIIVDALTYAGYYKSIENDIAESSHLFFHRVDLRFEDQVQAIFDKYPFHGILHFAAESHVDRSITHPNIFVETNVLGTLNLLNASLKNLIQHQIDHASFRYLQVSTDEVYGSLKDGEHPFTEEHKLRPNGPYSASKAAADLLVLSYFETYQLPILITRCSNNYGPYQFPEKLIPLLIDNALNDRPLPLYGHGQNIRDWIYVEDHVVGVWQAFLKGRVGEVYNFGGMSELRNIEVAHSILKSLHKGDHLITYIPDRKGHDYRYGIDFTKAARELNWGPQTSFREGLAKTIKWYQDHNKWVQDVKLREEMLSTPNQHFTSGSVMGTRERIV